MVEVIEYLDAEGVSPYAKWFRKLNREVAKSTGKMTKVGDIMALTRDYRITILERAQKDPGFRDGLLQKGVELLLEGRIETGKSFLTNYINATIGFECLARQLGQSSRSVRHMFGPNGKPEASKLFVVIKHLQKAGGLNLKVKALNAAEVKTRKAA